MAEEYGSPEAIVGGCLLGRPDAPDVLRRHAAHPRFRGVRDWESPTHLDVDEIAPAMDVAAELGLSIELRRAHDEFAVLDEIAARWPSVTVVLSHACLPLERSPADLAEWSAAMSRLAARPNVVCKISAVAGASDPEWTTASIRPWILSCVEQLRCRTLHARLELPRRPALRDVPGAHRRLPGGDRRARSERALGDLPPHRRARLPAGSGAMQQSVATASQ